MRITKLVADALERGYEMEHSGGFYTADRKQYRRYERMREAGLLQFWNGRRSRFWSAQFFTITSKGRAALNDYRRRAGRPRLTPIELRAAQPRSN